MTIRTASADATVFTVATTAAAGCCCIGSIDKTEKPEETRNEKVILGESVDPEKSDVWKIRKSNAGTTAKVSSGLHKLHENGA